MKTKLLSLAGVAVCVAALSSCVAYDDYGYVDGGYYGGGAPLVGRSTYIGYNNYGYGGYGYGYGTAYSSIGFFGLGGRGYYSGNHHHHHGSSGYRQSAGNRYASSVARPSSHRGSISSAPPRIPTVSAPRQLGRPSGSSLSRPSSSRSSSYRSAPPSIRSSGGRVTSASARSVSAPSRSSMSRPSSSRSSGDRRSR